jgi:immune inhibitor A
MKLDKTEKKILIVGGVIGFVFLLCFCAFAIVGISAFIIQKNIGPDSNFELSEVYPTPQLFRPEKLLEIETITILENTIIPEFNSDDIAKRFQGIEDIPATIIDAQAPYSVEDIKSFWITNTDTNDTFLQSTKLAYITEHAYFWIGIDVDYDFEDLKLLADTFENKMYPINRSFFGSEWTPGIDNDERIFIIYTGGIGINTAGYFSSADSIHPIVHEFSNGHETFIFNADNSPLAAPYTYSVLTHEFQHMIHWNQDKNESAWMNEGFSEVSVLLNGYNPGGFDYDYIRSPDYQLNDWPNDSDTSTSYGSSFLFLTYFLDRTGEEITKQLISNQENGLKSIDTVLAENNVPNSKTDQLLTADDLVLDWAITNYINDEDVEDGNYYYHIYSDAITASPTDTIGNCDLSSNRMSVHQYGVDYIRVTCGKSASIQFVGSTITSLLPENAYSGDYSFWSNKGDEANMSLSKKFDLTSHTGPLTFQYNTWFDIENDYDYVYLSTSTDGKNWEIVSTPAGTGTNPTGNSYGWGYSSTTEGWIQESIDLSRFAGEEVYIRFDYITDGAVNGEGFLIDDISIPEISYFTDFENDDGGWKGDGFVRVNNELQQTFKLALIRFGDEITVEYLPLPKDNKFDIRLNVGSNDEDIVLVVVGTTRYTRELATYEILISP